MEILISGICYNAICYHSQDSSALLDGIEAQVPTHILALHKIKILNTNNIQDYFLKNRVSSHISYDKTDHHVHGMKNNFYFKFMNGLDIINEQNLFNVLAKNHHVAIWVHYPLMPTTFT